MTHRSSPIRVSPLISLGTSSCSVSSPTRSRGGSGSFARRVIVGFALMVACFFSADFAAYAAGPPPYPATGGTPATWECSTVEAGSPPVPTGQDCEVTSWATNPPYPEPLPYPTVEPGASLVSLDDNQFEQLHYVGVLVVFLAAAGFVSSWRRRSSELFAAYLAGYVFVRGFQLLRSLLGAH